ncbi:MAG TPA: sigma-70 family RNA polymerase sigma factor [Candidatus Saccharimonas sp.]|nr:sigma-70 family RNA polymerase sigma factor [Candidatus Saccharimonas sp.]
MKQQVDTIRLTSMLSLVGTDLDEYIGFVRSIPLLSRAEELDLATLVQEGRDAAETMDATGKEPRTLIRAVTAGQQAKCRLIYHNLRFAQWAALVSMSSSTPWRPIRELEPDDEEEARQWRSGQVWTLRRFARDRLPLADRIQEANLGLIEAADAFHAAGKAKFVSYAGKAVIQRIAEAVVLERYRLGTPQQGRAGVGQAIGMARAQAARMKLERLTGYEPSARMIAYDTDMGELAVEYRLEELTYCPRGSLEELFDSLDLDDRETGEQLHPGDLVWEPGAPAGYDYVVVADRWDLVEAVLDTLSERERGVIRLRFGLADGRGRSLDEVGAAYRISRERVRQIEGSTMGKLRDYRRMEKLADFVAEEPLWQWHGTHLREPERNRRPAITVATHPHLYNLRDHPWLAELANPAKEPEAEPEGDLD